LAECQSTLSAFSYGALSYGRYYYSGWFTKNGDWYYFYVIGATTAATYKMDYKITVTSSGLDQPAGSDGNCTYTAVSGNS